MVSKSKILGKRSLIFVTVGSTNFSFDRLFAAVDNALQELKIEAQLVVQMGTSTYEWKYKNIRLYQYLKPKEMEDLFKKADKIITHAGFGTLFLLSSKSKYMPFIVSRLNYYKEHINNHQKDFIDFLIKNSKINLKPFIASEKLTSDLVDYLSSVPKSNFLKQAIFHQCNLNKISMNINNYLNQI